MTPRPQPGSGAHCSVQGKQQRQCHHRPAFMVFNGDGATLMSRLDSCCCANHLPRAIKLAWKDNRYRWPNGLFQ